MIVHLVGLKDIFHDDATYTPDHAHWNCLYTEKHVGIEPCDQLLTCMLT